MHLKIYLLPFFCWWERWAVRDQPHAKNGLEILLLLASHELVKWTRKITQAAHTASVYKCHQDICCLDKCCLDKCHSSRWFIKIGCVTTEIYLILSLCGWLLGGGGVSHFQLKQNFGKVRLGWVKVVFWVLTINQLLKFSSYTILEKMAFKLLNLRSSFVWAC